MNEFELLTLKGVSSGFSFDWDNSLRLTETSVTSNTLDIEITNTGQDNPFVTRQATFNLDRLQAAALRDAITEWLDQS